MSHELRTPLAVITASLEHLEAAPAPAQRGLVAEIRTATRRLNRLVGNLLDQTRLESGALTARLDWCDARDLINAAGEGVRDALAGHPYSVTVPEDLPPVRADFALMEHALANLLLNAAHHTPAGTPILRRPGFPRGPAGLLHRGRPGPRPARGPAREALPKVFPGRQGPGGRPRAGPVDRPRVRRRPGRADPRRRKIPAAGPALPFTFPTPRPSLNPTNDGRLPT